MGARWQCLGWIGQAVTGLPLRFSDPEGRIVLSVVNGQEHSHEAMITRMREPSSH